MKKFICAILTLAMVLSVCSFSVLAANGEPTVRLVIADPSIDSSAISAANLSNMNQFTATPSEVGDTFKLTIVVENWPSENMKNFQSKIKWDPTKIELIRKTGTSLKSDLSDTDNVKKTTFASNASVFPAKYTYFDEELEEDVEEDAFIQGMSKGATETGDTFFKDTMLLFSYMTSSLNTTGVPTADTDSFVTYTLYFKVLETGDTGLRFTDGDTYGCYYKDGATGTDYLYVNPNLDNTPIVIGGSAPVDDTTITAELGFDNAGKFAIDFIFNSTGTLATTANVVKQDGRTIAENVEITAENKSIGIATNDTNAIYTATAANGAECKASIYSVVIDDIMNSNYDKNITPINLKMINDVLAKGGLFTEGGALTAETAKIVTMNEDGSYSLTEKAVKAGITFAVDGVILGDTVDVLEAEVYALDAIQLEFVPELIEEVVVDNANEIESGSFEDIM